MSNLHQKGSISIFCLFTLSVLTVVGLGAASFATSSITRARNESSMAMTYDVAQAALEQGASLALQNANATGILSGTSYDVSSTLSGVVPGVSAVVTVKPDASGTYGYITSVTTNGKWTKSVRMRIFLTNVGLWNNAIVAGCGASGSTISGNVSIAGSVHIFGDGEAFTDLAGTGVYQAGDPFNDVLGTGVYQGPNPSTDLADSMSGNSGIYDNYAGMPAGLSSLIAAPPVVNGLQTLSTNVRVKHGEVSLGGSAEIGDPAISGTMKNTVDGTYVTDGFVGSAGAGAVHSDNGTSNAYDLGSYGLAFPYISGVGATTYTDSGGTSYPTETNYLTTKALTCPVTTITSSTAAFSYSDANGNAISFTPSVAGSQAVLTVTGIVKFTSAVQIGAKDSVYFKGNGTLFSTTNINIDGNFLPAAGQTYPTTTSIGIIAQNNINLATGNGSSQLSLAGAYYAQGTITSKKQNQIAGTFMANYFNMGINVPNIYQVPSLVQHMPPAMPGNKNIYVIHVHTWKQM